MADNGGDSALLEPSQTLEPAAGFIGQPSTPPQSSPGLSPGPAAPMSNWETIGEQRDFYDEQDCLHPSQALSSPKLQNREEGEVVIFDYSLDPDYLGRMDGNPLVEGNPSSGRPGADNDIFFRVPKDRLIESEEFSQITSPTGELGELSRAGRLGIIDFPQCYDTYDDHLLNSMGEKLGLQREGETAFMGAYLQRVRALPGRGLFRTGVSLRAQLKEPSGLSGSGPLEDRFILFVSFPYFGGLIEEITLNLGSESVKLLDFKRLGVDVPDRRPPANEEERDTREASIVGERDDIGEIIVHQARYMIFGNHVMATFRSKEDSTKDQVPLHRFQERIGAFRAMTHMIANRMESELPTLWKLQASLCKLEEDIDQMMSDAKTCEANQGMRRTPCDEPRREALPSGMTLTEEERQKWEEDDEQARKNNVWKRKQRTIRDLLTSLSTLSASLFAAISVAERQITILRDLHSVFLTSYRKKTKDPEEKYPLRRNPFCRSVAPIPILSENPEQIWPNTLDTIDEVVRERESFIKKVKELVENMDIRRKIFSAFLKSDQAKAAPSEETAQKTAKMMESTEKAIKETQVEIEQQGQTLSGFTIVTTAFLPLSFCSSYFGMSNIKKFSAEMTLRNFWLTTGPVFAVILLLTALLVLWKRPAAAGFRTRVGKKLNQLFKWKRPAAAGFRTRVEKKLSQLFKKKKVGDAESQDTAQGNSQEQPSDSSSNASQQGGGSREIKNQTAKIGSAVRSAAAATTAVQK